MKKFVKYAGGFCAAAAVLVLGLGVSRVFPAGQAREMAAHTIASQEETAISAPEEKGFTTYRMDDDSPGSVSAGEPEVYTRVCEYTVPYTIDQLLEESTLVAQGKVTEISAPFLIQGVGQAGEQVFTDYTIELEEAIRGQAPETTVTVRMEGDPNDISVVYEDAPVLEADKEYLLFLQKPGIGGGFNTAGDYYYVHGSRQGVYEPEAAAPASATEESLVFVSQTHLLGLDTQEGKVPRVVHKEADDVKGLGMDEGVLEWAAFTAKAQEVNAAKPVDGNYKRKEMEENLKFNVGSGFLSQEEYEGLLAEMNQYAQIIEE